MPPQKDLNNKTGNSSSDSPAKASNFDITLRYQALLARYVNNEELLKLRPREEDFSDIYKDFQKDIQNNIKKEEEFQKNPPQNFESSLQSKIFEGMLALDGNSLFGNEFKITLTSKHDDYINGVDLIFEAEAEDRSEKKKLLGQKEVIETEPIVRKKFIRFGIDTMVSENTDNVKRKSSGIVDRIKTGNNKIKYFKSSLEKGRVGLDSLPRFFLPLDGNLWNDVVNIYKQDAGKKILSQLFLEFIKKQTENQFLFSLGILYSKKGGLLARPSQEKLAYELFSKGKEIKNSDWATEDIKDLMSQFEDNKKVLEKFKYADPAQVEFLGNLKNIYDLVVSILEKKQNENVQEVPVNEKIAEPIFSSAISQIASRRFTADEVGLSHYVH